VQMPRYNIGLRQSYCKAGSGCNQLHTAGACYIAHGASDTHLHEQVSTNNPATSRRTAAVRAPPTIAACVTGSGPVCTPHAQAAGRANPPVALPCVPSVCTPERSGAEKGSVLLGCFWSYEEERGAWVASTVTPSLELSACDTDRIRRRGTGASAISSMHN